MKKYLYPIVVLFAFVELHAEVLVISGDGDADPFTETFQSTYFAPHGTVSSESVSNLFQADITAADSWAPGTTIQDHLNSFDLIIFGNGVGSGGNVGNYDKAGWAGVTSGILSISSYQVRSDRFGWSTLGSGTEYTDGASTDESNIVNGLHPITAGLASPLDIYSETPNLNSRVQLLGAGTHPSVLATIGGEVSIAVWDSGDTLASGHTTSGRRLFFALNQNAWPADNLTATGGDVFTDAVNWAVIPEPSSILLLLVGLSGTLLFKRRNGR